VRNVPGVHLLPSNRVTARDVAATKTIVVTQGALEKLEAALG
jgi:ribosomal protein L4